MANSICCFATRYLLAVRAIDICSFHSHSICCLRQRESIAPYLTSLALPVGNAYTLCEYTAVALALRASSPFGEYSQSNLHSLADKRDCRLASFDFRAARQRHIERRVSGAYRRSALLSRAYSKYNSLAILLFALCLTALYESSERCSSSLFA